MRVQKKKKGQLDNLGGLIQTLGFLAILLAVVFLVVAQIRTQVIAVENASSDDVKGYGMNATAQVLNSMADIPNWIPVIVITIIGGILLGLIQFFRQKQ